VTSQAVPEIRLLTPADAPNYRDIRLEGLRQNPEAFSSTFERESTMPLAWFEERLTMGNVFGAFIDGELLGVAGYRPQEGAKEAHKATLWGMYVSPSARHAGLGRGLIEAIVAHASGRVEQLKLVVTGGNDAAHRLYQKMGFSEYGREMKALKLDGRYLDEILMIRFLANG
jgi:ribosomal protein S18 acetylase RimI-like enzyme